MNSINEQVFLLISEKLELRDYHNLSLTNKHLAGLSLNLKPYIQKIFLKKYHIDYQSENCLLYHTLGKPETKRIQQEAEEKNYTSLFWLYRRLARQKKLVIFGNSCDCPLSFPLLPKLKTLYVEHKHLIFPLAEYKSLTSLTLVYCKILLFPKLPKLKVLDISRSEIQLEVWDKLELLHCDSSNLSRIPHYPNLNTLICKGNNLLNLPFLPKLIRLDSSYNPGLDLDLYLMPKLQELCCLGNHNITFSDNTPLKILIASDNLEIPSSLKIPRSSNRRAWDLNLSRTWLREESIYS